MSDHTENIVLSLMSAGINRATAEQILAEHDDTVRAALLAEQEKATAVAAPATPNAAARQTKLLARIRDEGGHWKTGRVVRTYGQLGYSGSVRTARFDLAVLCDAGHLIQHDESGVRFFTLNSQKGQRS